MAALPVSDRTPQSSDKIIVVRKSVYQDLHDALLAGFNDTASDVDGSHKWESMANIAAELLKTELKIGADVPTLTGVESKLMSAFLKANDKPELRGNIALALEKQVFAYEEEIAKRVRAPQLAN